MSEEMDPIAAEQAALDAANVEVAELSAVLISNQAAPADRRAAMLERISAEARASAAAQRLAFLQAQ